MGGRFWLAVLGVVGLATVPLSPAKAATVYPGCASPAANPHAHAYYVDPARGRADGDGSQAHPWRTLQEVVERGLIATAPTRWDPQTHRNIAGNPGAPVKPGDTIYLLSGDHGVVKLQGFFGAGLVGYANPDFITIAAAPGQTPVVRKLELLGGSKWVFRGLTFESTNNSGQYAAGGSPAPDYFLVSLRGPHENIIFEGNHLRSARDVTRWTNVDWVQKRASGILDNQGACIAITHNLFENIGNGMNSQRSNRVLISDNTINYFADDGIDYGSSDMLIEHNRITNSIEDGDGIHRDGMQGQPAGEQAVVENVAIRNNVVIRIADPTLAHPGFLQGIDTFDGVWKNVEVSGNLVIVDAWHGIAYYGVHGARITRNILLRDGGQLLPCTVNDPNACATHKVVVDNTATPGITIHAAKSKDPASDIVIDGNITTAIRIDPTTLNVAVRDNLCILVVRECSIGMPVHGVLQWYSKPGVYGDNNVVADFDAKGLFAAFDTINMKYDVTPKRRNPALRR